MILDGMGGKYEQIISIYPYFLHGFDGNDWDCYPKNPTT